MAVRVITDAHLYTAASIYLLLGMIWFALYSAIEEIHWLLYARYAQRSRDI